MNIDNNDKALLLNNGASTLSNITLYNEEGEQEFTFNEDNYLQEWTYEDYRYVPNTGFIGQFVERTFDGKLVGVPDNISLDGKEIKPELGIQDIVNSVTNYYPLGTFMITQIGEKDTTGAYSFQSSDYAKKFNTLYKDSGKYPCLALELLNDVCSQVKVEYVSDGMCICYAVTEDGLSAGNYCFKITDNEGNDVYYDFTLDTDLSLNDSLMLSLSQGKLIQKRVVIEGNLYDVERIEIPYVTSSSSSNTELQAAYIPYYDFTNNDFVIKDNQFDEDELCRDVVKAIAKLAYTWARINEADKLCLDFTKKDTSDVDEYDEIDSDLYYENIKTGDIVLPINKVLIGMSQADGENVYDSQNGDRIRLDKLNGETSQITYTGKNLLNTLNTEKKTLNGVTSTYDSATQTITFNGTCNANNTVFDFNCGTLNLNGTYTLSYEVISGTINPIGVTCIQFQRTSDWQGIALSLTQNNGTNTKSLSNFALNSHNIRFDNGAVLSNYKIRIQLEKNSSKTSWEPYVGGQASPNPDYPQNIETVTGRNVFSVGTKNLFNKDTEEVGKLIRNDGVELSIAAWTTSDYILVEPNTTYTISLETEQNSQLNFSEYNSSKSYTTQNSLDFRNGTKYNMFSVTTNNTTHYIRIGYRNDLTTGNIMLSKGNTHQDYVPYKKQEYEINLGKNLVRDSYTSSSLNQYNNVFYADFDVKPNTTYTISFEGTEGNHIYSNELLFTNSTNFTIQNGRTILTYTTKANISKSTATQYDSNLGMWIIFKNYTGGVASPNVFDNIQIEEGPTATNYAPYFEPIELCKIGDYQDYIYKNNYKWYLHKETGKVVLDGTQSISLQSINNYNIANFRVVFDDDYHDTTKYTNMLVDRFARQYSLISQTQTEGFLPTLDTSNNTLGVFLRVNSSRASTTTAMNTWLNSNNTTVYYTLDEATDIEITDTTLLNQLNTLNQNAITYDGNTYITVDTINEKPSLKLTITDINQNSTTQTGKDISVVGHEYAESGIYIYDNPLTHNEMLRKIALNGCERLFGLTYTPLTINTIGHPWLYGDSYIKVTNLSNQDLYTYSFDRKLTYKGYINSTISSTAENNVKQKYEYSKNMLYKITKTEIDVDKANNRITLLNKDVEDNYTKQSTFETTVSDITSTVKTIDDRTSENGPIVQQISQVQQSVNAIQNLFQITGGTNLIKNSAFLLDDDVWEFTDVGSGTHYHTPLGQGYNGSVIGSVVSKSQVQLKNIKMSSKIDSENIQVALLNTQHSFTYAYKMDTNTTATIKLIDTTTNTAVYEETLTPTNTITKMQFPPKPDEGEEQQIFTPTAIHYKLEVETQTTQDGSVYLYDMMFNSGDFKPWEPSSGEITSTILKLSMLGLQVISTGSNVATVMNASGFAVYPIDSSGNIGANPITSFNNVGLITGEAETTKVTIEKYVMDEMTLDGREHHVEYFKE